MSSKPKINPAAGNGKSRGQGVNSTPATQSVKRALIPKRVFTASKNSLSDSSLKSEGGGGGPLTWEDRAEMDVAYSQYLLAKMLERSMASNCSSIEASIETQLVALNNQAQQKMANIAVLKQRLLEVKSLSEEEKILDELIPQLERLAGNLGETIPVVDKVSESLSDSMNQAQVINMKLSSSNQEKELLAESLGKLAAENVPGEQTDNSVLSDLSRLASQLRANGDKLRLNADSCQQTLLPSCSKHLASCISLQYSAEQSKGANLTAE